MRKPPERATRMSFDDYPGPEQEFFLFRPDRGPEVLDRAAAGRPAVTDVRLQYPEGEQRLRAASGEVPAFPSLRRLIFDPRPEGAETAVARN